MRKNNRVKVFLASTGLIVCVAAFSPQAYAWQGHGGRDDSSGISISFKHGDVHLGFETLRHYPQPVSFYRPYRPEYLLLPSYYQQVIVNGVVYYRYNNVYYVWTSQGYQLVAPPMSVVQAVPVMTQTVVPAVLVSKEPSRDDAFTVNIPVEGGYKSLNIKRSGAGFQGPQGEYYPEFPRVEQLKVMYGK